MARRIIFVNRFYYPDHSATSQILGDLTRHLAAQGLDVRVVTSRSLYSDPKVRLAAREMADGVSILRVRTLRFGRSSLIGRILDYASFYPGAFIALLGQARRGDVVVVKTDPPLIGVVAALACRLKGAALVNWLQDLYPEIAAELGFKPLRGKLGSILAGMRNWSLRGAEANVVIGEQMADRLAAYNVPTVTLANWADDEVIQPNDAGALRREWGFEPDDFIVGYSGNLGRAHEAETVLEAARRLAHRSDIRFLFVGGGHGLEAVMAAGLPNVSLLGYQPRERLPQSLCVADVHWLSLRPRFEGLVLPSKMYGIAAAGRPIVAVCGKESEISRLVSLHGSGVAITPGDSEALATALEAMADDRAAVHAMGGRAREMLNRHFTRAASLGRWDQLLKAIGAKIG